MSTDIHTAFINALLADASYVEGLSKSVLSDVLISKLSPRLGTPLATYLSENFTVESQYTDPHKKGPCSNWNAGAAFGG
jgi:hypothetical protein